MNKQIIWHVVNSILAGMIFAGGALAGGGEITGKALMFAVILTVVTAAMKFKEYWASQEGTWTKSMAFIHY